jgi:hypothetical protein
MRVVSTAGIEAESPLAFAALQRLLWPLRERIGALPRPQQGALRAALGEVDGVGDRFLTFLGALSLLADAAERAPVLGVVDDAHWLDDASAAALSFVARRLQAERIALLFAARDGGAYDSWAPELPALVLSGVSGETASALLSARAGGVVDPEVRDRLVVATGGNPLALGELAEALTGEQMTGRVPLPAQLPLTSGVERGFLDRYRRLGEPAQRLLLLAAADDTGRLPVILEAAERSGMADDALDAVERAGLLRVDGDAVTLYHPLVRSAVYGGSTSAQRRAVHRVLAEVLTTDADRRAWHLAAAADRPDDDVVAALDGVAERAASRGGHEAAAAAWARAAELTAGGAGRGRRLFLAASSAWLGAHPSQAAALATAADVDVTDPLLRAELLSLQGQIAWNTRSLDEGYDLMLQAATVAAEVDQALALPLAMIAAALAVYGARSTRPTDLAALVGVLAPDAPARARVSAALLAAFLAAARRDWTTALDSFRSALALADLDPRDDDHVQRNLGIAALVLGEDERGLRVHEQLLDAARRAGALSMVEHALTRGVQVQIAVGAWATVASAAAEARALAASTGHPGLTALPTAQLAVVAALRGEESAERYLDEVAGYRQVHTGSLTDVVVVDLLNWARGLLAAHQPATALLFLEQITDLGLRRLAAVDRLETAVRAGREDLARTWLAELTEFATGTGAPAAVAVVEHGRALLADGSAAEEHFQRALTAHADSLRVPDRARTELAYGEFLRRARRRVDAREHLRAALALFEGLATVPWAERAAAELRASGETARRRDVSTATELTAQ